MHSLLWFSDHRSASVALEQGVGDLRPDLCRLPHQTLDGDELPHVLAAYGQGQETLETLETQAAEESRGLGAAAETIKHLAEGRKEVEANAATVAGNLKEGSVAAGEISRRAGEEIRRERGEEGRGRVVSAQMKNAEVDSMRAAISRQQEILEDALDGHEIKIYPNPTRGKITVSIAGLEKELARVLVFSPQGRLIADKKFTGPENTVDLSAQPAGMYLMKIVIGGLSTDWKIVKD